MRGICQGFIPSPVNTMFIYIRKEKKRKKGEANARPFIWRLFPFAGRVRFIKVLEREYEFLRGKEGNRRAYKPNAENG